MRIGVIGMGVIAPYFLAAIDGHESTTLTAICDLRSDRMSMAPPGVATFQDHKELIASGLVDAVVLTLPNQAHAKVASDALRAGLHVCCEKPLTVHPGDAVQLVKLARDEKRTLFTAFHRRYNVHIRKMRERLPELSKVASVHARYHERIQEHSGGDAWYLDRDRCGGGCLIDNGPNALDAVRQLVGDLTVLDATIGDVRAGVEFRANVQLVSDAGVPVTVELDWTLPTGEVKDIELRMLDGSVEQVDLLEGFSTFKSSLDHEYTGIIDDFLLTVHQGRDPGDEATTVALIDACYQVSRAKEQRIDMPTKAPCEATLVKLLFHRRSERGMELSEWTSRCIRRGELHEIVTTTDKPATLGARVDRVGFLGFAEFHDATVLERGDVISCRGRKIGTLAGFDECHYPNHYNIVVDVESVVTAEDLDLKIGEPITFSPPV